MQVLFFDQYIRQVILPLYIIINSQGDFMVVYIDSLIFTNIIIDYLLLNLTGLITRKTYRLKRLIPACLLGGVSSIYIFVQSSSILLDIAYQMTVAALMVVIANKIKRIKNFFYTMAVFLCLSFSLNGLAVFVYGHLKTDLVLLDNMVYYLNISPVSLVLITVIIYIILIFIQKVANKKHKISDASLTVKLGEECFNFTAMVDTGNVLTDPFSDSVVFVVDRDGYKKIEKALNKDDVLLRKRLIPAKTIGEELLLDAVRCDEARIVLDKESFSYDKPIVAASSKGIEGDYNAIIPYLAVGRISD